MMISLSGTLIRLTLFDSNYLMPDDFSLQEKSATTQLVKHWWFNKVDMTLASHIAKQTYCYVNFNMKRLSGAKHSKKTNYHRL